VKSYSISKHVVKAAYEEVKTNKGSAGVDGQTLEQFQSREEDNLYKLWNRMSSGSYFPQPVKRVEIPKGDGGRRPLGIPTVSDRIAQTVVKMYLEPELEPYFHRDSYGYRPGKSAHEALGVARQRCWRYSWVLDLDVQGFFDNIDHELLMKAVRKHTGCKWMLLYIERWLQAPVQLADGALMDNGKGTPQGGVISPLLANLFLHYVFDKWMEIHIPSIPFERYADDIICHCKSEEQAQWLLNRLTDRFGQCKLILHPEKTKIVYCKDDVRPGSHPNQKFDFLGHTFRPRGAKRRGGKLFVGFLPAISNKAATRLRQTMRRWQVHLRSDLTLADIASKVNPRLRGWMAYFGKFYRSELDRSLRTFDRHLVRWAMRKYKKLKGKPRKAKQWLRGVKDRQPDLFVYWSFS